MSVELNSNKTMVLTVLGALLIGWFSAWLWFSSGGEVENGEKKPIYWVAPMDANYKRDKPGKSPMGMDLIPVYEDGSQSGSNAEGTVRISPTVAHNMGVRVATVESGSLDLKINTVGYISFDEDSLTHFHSRVDGWIEKLSVTAVGDSIKKGQKLFELYSPKLVTAGEEYLAALSSGSSILINGSKSKLGALGVEPEQIENIKRTRKVPQRLAFYANQDGTIAALNVREGMFIQPATTVMSLGGLDQVWVTAEIFERQAAWIKVGQAVDMTVSSYANEIWKGKIDYIYPVVNAQTRTLRARIKFDNPNHYLKPDMFAELAIHSGVRDNVLSIPREAVIRDGRMSRVVKVLETGEYLSSRIETGIESNDRVEVSKGLEAGDKVVISAQFLIDSESSTKADLTRIEGDAKDIDKISSGCVWAEGVIQSLMKDHRMVTIDHQAIQELKWPAMTMDFIFSTDVELAHLEIGQAIHFCLEQTEDKQYLITAIKLPKNDLPDQQPADKKLKQEHHHD